MSKRRNQNRKNSTQGKGSKGQGVGRYSDWTKPVFVKFTSAVSSTGAKGQRSTSDHSGKSVKYLIGGLETHHVGHGK